MPKRVMIIMDLSTVESGVRSIGGVDTVCQMHLEGLRRCGDSGDEYIVLTFNGANDLTRDGEIRMIAPNIELHSYNYDRRNGLARLLPNVVLNELLVRRYIKRFRPALVHSHNPAWHIFRYASEKKVLTLHSYKKIARSSAGILNDFIHERVIQRQSVAAADTIFTVSMEIIERLKEIDKNNITYIPNPIAERFFYNRRELPNDTINMLLLGVVSPRKRTMDALKLIHVLHRQKNNIHLYIAGRYSHGDQYYKALGEYIRKNNLEDNVHFVGSLDAPSLRDQLSRTHIGLSLSDNESFGLAPLEMLASGVPIIASDVGVFRWHRDELQKRGVDLIQPGDIALAAQVISARIRNKDFSTTPDLRTYLEASFSMHRYIDRNERGYRTAMRGDVGPRTLTKLNDVPSLYGGVEDVDERT